MTWIYKVVGLGAGRSDHEKTLNSYGLEDWEFVAVSDNYAYFKKQVGTSAVVFAPGPAKETSKETRDAISAEDRTVEAKLTDEGLKNWLAALQRIQALHRIQPIAPKDSEPLLKKTSPFSKKAVPASGEPIGSSPLVNKKAKATPPLGGKIPRDGEPGLLPAIRDDAKGDSSAADKE